MKISFNWLREYADCPVGPAELAERLTMHGLEVETVTPFSPRLDGIVVGKVLKVEAHPNAGKLSICAVTDGSREYTIVCGAGNVSPGCFAPLAGVGVRLPDGTRIREAKLRGVVSEGMLCSERELELGEEAEGIMLLSPDSVPGADLVKSLSLDDHILEINVTPNRPDCLGVIGVAREVAAVLGTTFTMPRVHVREEGDRIGNLVSVKVRSAELCRRYTARLIRDVSVRRSPFWLRSRLGLVGVRTVNNVVDVTNYVCMEYGQPLHSFDFGKIKGGRIVVRTASPCEVIKTIDGVEHSLGEGMLVIAGEARPIAVAGVMGGAESEITDETRDVLLESAWFQPQSIRRTSRSLAVSSESSYRFERGVDPDGVVPTLNRAAALIALTAGGSVCRGVADVRSKTSRRRPISLNVARLNDILGTGISGGEAAACLKKLNMAVRRRGKSTLVVSPPSYRVDVNREVDLVEEIARLRGYDSIRAVPPSGIAAEESGTARGREKISEVLCSLGFSEAVCVSFMGADEMDRLKFPAEGPLRMAVRLRNPVSEEFCFLRTSMLPPLIRCLSLNASRGNHGVRLFELGSVFIADQGEGHPREIERLALAAMGPVGRSNWCSRAPEADFFYLKGVLEALCGDAGKRLTVRQDDLPWCHPGRCASLCRDGMACGWLGEIHPRIAGAYDLRSRIIFAEVDAAPLYEGLLAERLYRPLPRFPSVSRDIAFVAEESFEAGSLIEDVRKAAGDLVEKVELFDLFRGEQIPRGKKGLAISVTLRSHRATLTEREIESVMERTEKALKEMGCEIRR